MTARTSSATTVVGWIATVAVIACLPWMAVNPADIRLITLIAILALTVSGLNLTLGYAGELALNQVAVYAGGAYMTGYVAINITGDLLVCLALSITIALVLGFVTGLPGLRLGGWTLAITSFFMVILVPSVINIFGDTLGGLAGLNGIPLPTLFGRELDPNAFYVVVVLIAAGWFVCFRNLVLSLRGSGLLVLKESPVLAAAVGTPPHRTKLTVYVLSAMPAGIAGCFIAFLDSYLAPVSFGLPLVIVVLAASILGGPKSVFGALIGAAIMQIGPMRATAFDEYAEVAYGAFLVLGGLVLRNGIAGLARGLFGWARSRFRKPDDLRVVPKRTEDTVDFPTVDGRTLVIDGVSKRFGGNVAVDDVSVEAQPGEVTALIGPNGSGKTTLMNLVSGYYRLDNGSIQLGGETISGRPAFKVARAGVGRTFQTPIVPDGINVEETIMTGRLSQRRTSLLSTILRLPAFWRADKDNRATSRQIMEALGLDHLASTPAADLALGTRRMLELGRAVAAGSSLVLLDEVASGLDEDDIQGLVDVVRKLRDAGVTVVLVEHNFSLVRAIADHVVVLAEGRVLAQGAADDVANDPEVMRTYLGEGGELSGTSLNDDERATSTREPV